MISVMCPCGKKLKAPASAVGKKAKCPKCGNVMTVKAPPPPEEDNSLDALYDLAAAGEQAAAKQQLAPRCPGCQSPLAANAVLCVNCGYDTRSGKSLAPKVEAAVTAPPPLPKSAAKGTRYDPAKAAAAEAAAKNKKKGPGVDKMAPQASYIGGLGGCCAGAAVGGFIWFLIAYFTGYELYFVVLLVGGLAGAGMAWGQQGYSYVGGFTAAGVTFITMIVARIAVVMALILPMMRDEVAYDAALEKPDLSMYDERVVDQMVQQEMKTAKPIPLPEKYAKKKKKSSEDEEDEGPSQEDLKEVAAYQAVEKKLKAMPKKDYDAMVLKLEQEEQRAELQTMLWEEILKKEFQVNPDHAGSVQSEAAHKTAKERVAAMSQAQRDAEYKRLTAEEAKESARELEQAKAESAARKAKGLDKNDGVSKGAVAAFGAVVIFFLVFGGISGAFWTICALGLAYRTASGSVSDS
jgi:hypothetical protein